MDVEGAHAAIQLPEGSWWDWDVVGWDGGELRLAAGHDLSYYHSLELVFGDPFFVSCPSTFYDPVFRAPTLDELLKVTRQLGEEPAVVVAFEADAATLLLNSGCVVRLVRDDLSCGRFPVVRPWG
ncbi:hypothetical protein [Streptomyces sp. NBC_01233]|uniref:hypothetical protein n=1 Tax=Streptomyces sp. NBC_01233 TaxID=2903787 RepID=UPI002E112771|nr:hypothetical protein OG332_07455 [Streptomyces sp. NBC_01233]